MSHAPGPGPRRRLAGRLGLLLAGLAVGALTFLVALQVRSAGDGTTTSPSSAPPGPSGSAVTPAPTTLPPATDATDGESGSQPSAVGPLDGLTIALDPGHDGGNAAHPLTVNAPVSDGRGGTKACNTVGTSTDGGYPEHAFAWDVSSRLGAELAELGATVVVTREDDEGVGPCVDVRGRFGQENDADLLVSVHANGSEDRSVQGFFAIVADPPVHAAQGAPSLALAGSLVDALADEGFAPSGAYDDAVSRRADLATLNHAEVPAVMLELGEMRNAEEGGLMETGKGRQRYADALAAGVVAWAQESGVPDAP